MPIRATATSIFFLTFLVSGAGVSRASAEELIRLQVPEPGALQIQGFELTEPQSVKITATGYREEAGWGFWSDDSQSALTEAWVLDSVSREILWSTAESEPDESRGRLSEHRGTLPLKAGTYEVYFSSLAPPTHDAEEEESWVAKLGQAMSSSYKDWDAYREALPKLGVTLEGRGRALDAEDLGAVRQQGISSALVALIGLGDAQIVSRGFELDEPTRLEIYALGEMFPHRSQDRGWIIDLENRRRVWEMTYEISTPAGGAKKNRQVRTRVKLPAGRYAAFFVTDNSHSKSGWDALPPRDPDFWGLTLRMVDPEQTGTTRSFEHQEFPDDRILVELTGFGDNEQRSIGITLDVPLDVRIYALGEGDTRRLYDQGRIVDAETQQTVWIMEPQKTQHAGGTRKNRVNDEIVHLEAGNYEISYGTDDSHSSEDWNAAPPMHPDRWGISLFAEGEDFDPSTVREYKVTDSDQR